MQQAYANNQFPCPPAGAWCNQYAMKDANVMEAAFQMQAAHTKPMQHFPHNFQSIPSGPSTGSSSPATDRDSDERESSRSPSASSAFDKKARHKLVEQNRREKKRLLCNELQQMVNPGTAPGARLESSFTFLLICLRALALIPIWIDAFRVLHMALHIPNSSSVQRFGIKCSIICPFLYV
jgi:hypothetical protein